MYREFQSVILESKKMYREFQSVILESKKSYITYTLFIFSGLRKRD